MSTGSTADVVIVGGGVIGASIAFHLASRGAGKIVVCERRWVAAGASGKSGALVRMHYTNQPEATLAHASLPYFQHWDEHVGRGDCGFLKTGMLRFVSPENVSNLEANVEMLERIGVDNRVVGPSDVREIAPGWQTDDVVAAAYEPASGCADPVGTTHGFLDRAAELGTDVRVGLEVTGITVAGGKVTGVETSAGPISAPVVVIAGGAWGIPLLRGVGVDVPLQPVRVQVAVFKRPPQLGPVHPICIDGVNELWLRPEGPNWGSTLIGFSRRQTVDDPDALDEGVDGDYVPEARVRLARRIPGMEQSTMRGGWAGVVTSTLDGKPILDRVPDAEGVYFFAGDNGSSFKTAPAIGRIFSEWIVDGAPALMDIRPFRLARYAENDPLVGPHEYDDRDSDAARARGVMLG